MGEEWFNVGLFRHNRWSDAFGSMHYRSIYMDSVCKDIFQKKSG